MCILKNFPNASSPDVLNDLIIRSWQLLIQVKKCKESIHFFSWFIMKSCFQKVKTMKSWWAKTILPRKIFLKSWKKLRDASQVAIAHITEHPQWFQPLQCMCKEASDKNHLCMESVCLLSSLGPANALWQCVHGNLSVASWVLRCVRSFDRHEKHLPQYTHLWALLWLTRCTLSEFSLTKSLLHKLQVNGAGEEVSCGGTTRGLCKRWRGWWEGICGEIKTVDQDTEIAS